MPDKVEREIEEILSKFSEFSGETENKSTEQPEIIPFTKKPGIAGHWKSLNKNRRFEKKSVFSNTTPCPIVAEKFPKIIRSNFNPAILRSL